MSSPANSAKNLYDQFSRLSGDIRADHRARRLEHLLQAILNSPDVWGSGAAGQVHAETQAIFPIVARINSWSATEGARAEDLDDSLNEIDSHTTRLADMALPFLILRSLSRENNLRSLESDVRSALKQFNQRQSQLVDNLESRLRQLDESRDRAQKAVDEIIQLGTKGLVAKRAGVFQEAQFAHRRAAWAWTGAAGLLAAATCGWLWALGFGSLSLPGDSWQDPEALRVALASACLVAVGFSATTYAARLATAHRHNATVYAQKATALASFLAFAETATKDEMRMLLLGKLADTVFVQNHTAFLNGKAEIEHPLSSSMVDALQKVRDLR